MISQKVSKVRNSSTDLEVSDETSETQNRLKSTELEPNPINSLNPTFTSSNSPSTTFTKTNFHNNVASPKDTSNPDQILLSKWSEKELDELKNDNYTIVNNSPKKKTSNSRKNSIPKNNIEKDFNTISFSEQSKIDYQPSIDEAINIKNNKKTQENIPKIQKNIKTQKPQKKNITNKEPIPQNFLNIFNDMSSIDNHKRFDLAYKLFFNEGNYESENQLQNFFDNFYQTLISDQDLLNEKSSLKDIEIGVKQIKCLPPKTAWFDDDTPDATNHAHVSINLPPNLQKKELKEKINAIFITSSDNSTFKIIDDHSDNLQNLVLLQINYPPHLNTIYLNALSNRLLEPYGKIILTSETPPATSIISNFKFIDPNKSKTMFIIFNITDNCLPPSINFITRDLDEENSPDIKIEVHVRSSLKFCPFCRSLTHTLNKCPIRPFCHVCQTDSHTFLSCHHQDHTSKRELFHKLPNKVQTTFYQRCNLRSDLPLWLKEEISFYNSTNITNYKIQAEKHNLSENHPTGETRKREISTPSTPKSTLVKDKTLSPLHSTNPSPKKKPKQMPTKIFHISLTTDTTENTSPEKKFTSNDNTIITKTNISEIKGKPNDLTKLSPESSKSSETKSLIPFSIPNFKYFPPLTNPTEQTENTTHIKNLFPKDSSIHNKQFNQED